MKKIGFIGAGNMGSAMMSGIVKAGAVHVTAADKNPAVLERLEKELGVKPGDNQTVARTADILFLAVKPNILLDVIEEIKDIVRQDALVVSIAAGKTLDTLNSAFSRELKIVRVMPNTPALVGEGMSALALNAVAAKPEHAKEIQELVELFESFGKAEIVSEKLMDAVTAVSGSSPAYVFMFIEAMADAAVLGGMPRAQAYTFAAQAVLGSAKMVLETGRHPGELKDMVCSPAGTTIEAVKVLEKTGLRNAVIQAMEACIDKSKSM